MNPASHLTEEDFDEVLMDIAAPTARDHAGACPACTQRLQAFQATIANFNHASLAWSQAKSNTLTRDLSGHQSRPALTLAALSSYAAAALLAAAILLTTGLSHHDLSLQADQTTLNAPTVSAEEIADDNAMLHAIDSELCRPVSIPAALAEDPEVHALRHAE